MLAASLLAGIAFSQTRTTGIHALSFPLTAEYGASHGTACAVTLPAFIRLCGEQDKDRMQRLASFLGFDSAAKLADNIEKLMQEMGMVTRLSQLGVSETDLDHITETGLQAAIIHLTPAKMDHDSVRSLLHSIL